MAGDRFHLPGAGAIQQRRAVPGTAQRQHAGIAFEARQRRGDEHARRPDLVRDLAVERSREFVGFHPGRVAAVVRTERTHQQRRVDAVPGGIRHHRIDVPEVRAERVEVVAADALRGDRAPRELVLVGRRRPIRLQPLLDRLGDLEFARDHLAVGRESLQAQTVQQRRRQLREALQPAHEVPRLRRVDDRIEQQAQTRLHAVVAQRQHDEVLQDRRDAVRGHHRHADAVFRASLDPIRAAHRQMRRLRHQHVGPGATVDAVEAGEQRVRDAERLLEPQTGLGIADLVQHVERTRRRLHHVRREAQQPRRHRLGVALLEQHDAFFQGLQAGAVVLGRLPRLGVQRDVDQRRTEVHQHIFEVCAIGLVQCRADQQFAELLLPVEHRQPLRRRQRPILATDPLLAAQGIARADREAQLVRARHAIGDAQRAVDARQGGSEQYLQRAFEVVLRAVGMQGGHRNGIAHGLCDRPGHGCFRGSACPGP